MLKARTLLIVFLVLISFSAFVSAQEDANTLTYSVVSEGEITNRAFSQTWTFQTASADRIVIRVQRTGGNLIPEFSLLDNNNQQITSAYTDNTGAYAETSATLPGKGTFQVLVQRRDGGTGLTTGAYSIVIIPLATAEDNPNNTVVLGEITEGSPVTGEITGAQWYHRYSYTAAGKDVIQVTALRTGGSLYPEIEVLDANGTPLSTGYNDYRTGESAQIESLELPGPGTYTIAVTRASRASGESTGNYSLNVTTLGFGEDHPTLAVTDGEIQYDTAIRGELDAKWYDDYTLTTDAGDTITVIVERASSNLVPELRLLGGSGQDLSYGYSSGDGTTATIWRYQLDGPGTYTVRVLRNGGKTGWSVGAYSLTVRLYGSGLGSSRLADPSGAIELGQEVTEIITNERWADGWTFAGRADQPIDIIVTRTNGTLIPRLSVLDSNGQELTSGWYGPAWDSAEITGYTPPSDGAYTIVVLRDGEQNGLTTGGYILSVKRAGS
jgi:hypothetical protein